MGSVYITYHCFFVMIAVKHRELCGECEEVVYENEYAQPTNEYNR